MDGVKLRALEPEDIDVLYSIENNKELWKYSNRNEPYSKSVSYTHLTLPTTPYV